MRSQSNLYFQRFLLEFIITIQPTWRKAPVTRALQPEETRASISSIPPRRTRLIPPITANIGGFRAIKSKMTSKSVSDTVIPHN